MFVLEDPIQRGGFQPSWLKMADVRCIFIRRSRLAVQCSTLNFLAGIVQLSIVGAIVRYRFERLDIVPSNIIDRGVIENGNR